MTIGLTEPKLYLRVKLADMQNITTFQDVLFDGNILQIRLKDGDSDAINHIVKSCIESISYPMARLKDAPININLVSGKTIVYTGTYEALMEWFKS